MIIVIRLENVMLNFGLYKVGKQDYPYLNYATDYKRNMGWQSESREHTHISNHKDDLALANERLLIRPYAKIVPLVRDLIEQGNCVVFVSALNENFCKDFLEQMKFDEQTIYYNVERIESSFLEQEFNGAEKDQVCIISGDLEEVSSLGENDSIFTIAALWGTTKWLEQDFTVNAVVEKVEEIENLYLSKEFFIQEKRNITDKMKSSLLIFKNKDKIACFEEIVRSLKQSGLVRDWEKERKRVGDRAFIPTSFMSLEERKMEYGIYFVDGLDRDWNNPCLPYIKINTETLKYYIGVDLKSRKGFLHLYLQVLNYINYISENGKIVETPSKGSSWTAREVALLKYYARHKVFDKAKVQYGFRNRIFDLTCLLPGRTEMAVLSKMKELGISLKVKN